MLPDILRPNVPSFNEPGALCNDAQAATRHLPGEVAGRQRARVLAAAAVSELAGPVYIVQEIGNLLPKRLRAAARADRLRGAAEGAQQLLPGRPRSINTFESVPDVPQSYFELNINGGPDGILNNFDDLCTGSDVDRRSTRRSRRTTARSPTTKPRLEIRGCEESDLRAASHLDAGSVKVSKRASPRSRSAASARRHVHAAA